MWKWFLVVLFVAVASLTIPKKVFAGTGGLCPDDSCFQYDCTCGGIYPPGCTNGPGTICYNCDAPGCCHGGYRHYNLDCGAQTCDECTQVCCINGCHSIESGCGGGTPPPSGGGGVNCSNLTITGNKDDSGNLIVGNDYNLTADYNFNGGGNPQNQIMFVRQGTGCGTIIKESLIAAPSAPAFTWKPAAIGTYRVYCYTSAIGYAACTGYDKTCDTTSDYNCAGPDASKMVNVVVSAPSCNATKPSGLSSTRVSATKAKFNWNAGTGGSKQYLYVGTNKTEVESDCTGCVVKLQNLNSSLETYTTGNVLTAGTVYYWRVGNYEDAVCGTQWSPTHIHLSSCELSPPSMPLKVDANSTLTSVVYSSPEITRIDFTKNNAHVSFSRTSDSGYPFNTVVTGVSQGSTTLTGTVVGNTPSCSDLITATVTADDPWWQVVDGDVTTDGDLNSDIPSTAGLYFDSNGSGGYPGIPVYGGTTILTSSNVSSKSWLVNSGYVNPNNKVYDYDYFYGLIPDDILKNDINLVSSSSEPGTFFESGGVTDSNGYTWYKYDGSGGLDLHITSAISLGTRKVILLVDSADLYINGRINYTPGSGSFMVIVGKSSSETRGGNIIVDPTVGGSATADLQGFYLADVRFDTGDGSLSLHIKGSIAAYKGIVLNRDLGAALNSTTPSEIFEFSPGDILNYPSELGVRKMSWKEVAP